jgi:rifampicin phosphotransferase
MDETELRWDPPGPGQWWPVLDHFPKPVSRLFAELFPAMARGWITGARRYGVPGGASRWATVNCWFFYAPGDPEPVDLDRLDATAAETLETCRWREEPRRWHEEERPAVLATNLALQDEPLDALDDAGLADHFRRAVAHYEAVSPLHFEHQGFGYAAGSLIAACEEWGIDAEALLPLFAGASPASSAARDHVERIAAALAARGVTSIESCDGARGDDLDDYLRLYGQRLVENRDLVDPSLVERPDLVVGTINAALGSGPFRAAAGAPEPDVAAVRARVPEGDRPRFDALLADARACYGLGDDDEGICFLWPLGLIRRAVLEAGRRLAARGAVHEPSHLLDAGSDEIVGLLTGAGGPSAGELAARADERHRAAASLPPGPLGDPPDPAPVQELPPNVQRLMALSARRWARHSAGDGEELRGTGVGDTVHRGRVCFVTDGVDALDRLEPGDVLVAIATNPGFNAVFPIAGAVVTEEGGPMCHAAVLARELGLPAVVGVAGLRRIRDGVVVEVDPVAGAVRVVG